MKVEDQAHMSNIFLDIKKFFWLPEKRAEINIIGSFNLIFKKTDSMTERNSI